MVPPPILAIGMLELEDSPSLLILRAGKLGTWGCSFHAGQMSGAGNLFFELALLADIVASFRPSVILRIKLQWTAGVGCFPAARLCQGPHDVMGREGCRRGRGCD